MDKKQFIEETNQEKGDLIEALVETHGIDREEAVCIVDRTFYPILQAKLSECWDMAGEEINKKIDTKYPPYTFSIDMGSYASLVMGVQEVTHVRMATKEEIEIINFIKSLTSKQEEKV